MQERKIYPLVMRPGLESESEAYARALAVARNDGAKTMVRTFTARDGRTIEVWEGDKGQYLVPRTSNRLITQGALSIEQANAMLMEDCKSA